MEPNFADKPSARLVYDIMAGLRIRYAPLNSAPLNNAPMPMLNSPAESGAAAGNAFCVSVQLRLAQSRQCRRVLNEVLSGNKHTTPDYADIVRQINLCLAEVGPLLNRREISQDLGIRIVEIEYLLEKMRGITFSY
jgi:hypothetical protein